MDARGVDCSSCTLWCPLIVSLYTSIPFTIFATLLSASSQYEKKIEANFLRKKQRLKRGLLILWKNRRMLRCQRTLKHKFNRVCWHRNYGHRRQMLLGALPTTGLKIETRGYRNTRTCASLKFINLTAGPSYAHWNCHCGCRFSYLKQLPLFSVLKHHLSLSQQLTIYFDIRNPSFFGIITNKLCQLFLLLLILLILCKCMKFNGTHILHVEYAYSLLTVLTLIFT